MFGYVKYSPYLCTIFFTTKLKKNERIRIIRRQ
jgi:hypothetical protein